jgi:hypothetical protein
MRDPSHVVAGLRAGSRPSSRVIRAFVLTSAVVASTLIGTLAARAETEEIGEEGQAGFSVFLEAAPQVIVQRARGSIDASFEMAPSRKSNIVTNLTFRLGGGVKGPVVAGLPGRARPVVFAAALVPINESSTIGSLLIEESSPGAERIEDSKYSIEYQTSATAGLGLEFSVPLLDSEIAITPSIQSLHLVSRYVGEASLNLSGGGVSQVNEVRGKKRITQHFLGPALRVATPPVDVRGLTVVFLLDAGILLDVAGTREQFEADGTPNSSGVLNFETGSGVATVTSGIQIRWP